MEEYITLTGPPVDGVAEEDRVLILPDSYYTLLQQVSPDADGIERVRELIHLLRSVPEADRDRAREIYRTLAGKEMELNASDLDMGGPACKEQIWYRVDGFKKPYQEFGRISYGETDLILLSLLSHHQQDHLLKHYAVDFGYSLPKPEGGQPQRFRTTVYFDNQWLAVSMRLLAAKPFVLRSLGFHPLIERGFLFRYVRDGLTLFTGVTGTGKSTSLDAIIHANNEDFEGHILIIAQPLEYIHESKRCIVRHREVGVDVESFVDGMVQGLRQDPDIVVVGEMRDPATITTAMEMSDTGHKVFSTLHTGSAVETVDRIIAEYPPVEQDRIRSRLADVLRCVVSQKLLPRIGGGRVLAKEVLWMTSSSRAAIKNGNTNEIYQMIWEGRDQGMTTLEQDLVRLVGLGEITAEDALGYANNKRRILQLMR